MSNKDTLAASGGNNEQGATEADATAFRQGNHALAAHPEASPKRRVVNPAGTTIQSASLEPRARELLGRHAPLNQGVVTTKQAIRAITAALANQQGVGGSIEAAVAAYEATPPGVDWKARAIRAAIAAWNGE